MLVEKQNRELKIRRDDPLFGVLSDEQVGLDMTTGRRKINTEVLQNMREYILAAEGREKRVREERVKKSVLDLENDPIGQRDFLRLEAAPLVIREVDKDKGLVFDYSMKNLENQDLGNKAREKLKRTMADEPRATVSLPLVGVATDKENPLEFFECSTGFSAGYAGANSSGTSKFKGGKRFRPPKKMRKFKPRTVGLDGGEAKGKGISEGDEKISPKRRAECVAGGVTRVARRSKTEVVPSGGLPNQ